MLEWLNNTDKSHIRERSKEWQERSKEWHVSDVTVGQNKFDSVFFILIKNAFDSLIHNNLFPDVGCLIIFIIQRGACE